MGSAEVTPGAILKAALGVLGLSQAEGAAYLGVSIETVSSWVRDRRGIPPGVWGELAELFDRMQTAADAALDLIDETEPDEIAATSTGAHGEWPSHGCAAAVTALVVLESGVPPASAD